MNVTVVRAGVVVGDERAETLNKEKFNLALPPPILEAFDPIAKSYGARKKWAFYSAAILMALENRPEILAHYVAEVLGADTTPQSMGALIERAKGMDLRRDAEKSLPKPPPTVKRQGDVIPRQTPEGKSPTRIL